MQENKKKVPTSIGIFGAGGHIGAPMVRWLRYKAPQVRLRLISSNEKTAERLRADFPDCEIAVGNYYDAPSLTSAVAGLEGLFVNAPGGTREQEAMTNLVAAVRASGSIVHIIRTVGMFPSINPKRIPESLQKTGTGLEIQHPIARRVLEDSDLPVTFFNLGATFMDNFIGNRLPMLAGGKLTWANRRVPFIDPREIGEAAARILLSDNARHIYQFHTLNNNHDNLNMAEAAKLMSDVLLMNIDYDDSWEGFRAIFEPGIKAGFVPPALPQNLWNFFLYEDANDVAWALNDFLERTLGRKPNTLRSWMQEHRQQLSEKLTKQA